MKAMLAGTKAELSRFYGVEKVVYSDNPFHRDTETDILRLLVEGPTVFHKHASVYPYVLTSEGKTVGRFAVIYDQKLPDHVQISFFEALPGMVGVVDTMLEQARALFPEVKSVVVGLNGHLNYGAGFLLNRFDEAPMFGLPYTPAYYTDYFQGYRQRRMVSFRSDVCAFLKAFGDPELGAEVADITVRHMRRRCLRDEVRIYTYLNNRCFLEHPFWAERTVEEDFELFNPFRFLLKEENLLFAELDGEPVGFLLWYPDFNQLVSRSEPIGFQHVLRYRLANPVTVCRFAEIGVLPEFRKTRVALALLRELGRMIQRAGYLCCEGGFIFEENVASIALVQSMFRTSLGQKGEPYRRYAVFECEL